jgi:hypothetical protein
MPIERRTVTPAQERDQLAGGERLAPGVWIDRDGALHFSVPELLAVFGWEDTPATRDEVTAIVRACVAREFPDTTIVEQERES